MLHLVTDPNAWLALITLSVLEIVLGIDNIVFISVLIARLPAKRALMARRVGIGLALVFRIALLLMLTWIMRLTAPLFTLFGNDFSWRDLILIGGGLFLIAKGTHEIHSEVEAQVEDTEPRTGRQAFVWIIAQLVTIDLVFSLDSIITAIGLAQDVEIMIAAVVIAMLVMYFAASPVSKFIQKYPTTKMLALSFLLLIGVALVADGLGFHIPRGYIYFAMAFAGAVEVFNVLALRNRRRRPKALGRKLESK
ncbi:TerC family protein [Pseudorhodoplanes sp.]|uniref:TerC family protein n=1 Tax=Pseudorhodoplanes sp. TaxID=1934341 RepID=UPI002CE77583|nr:TerC family protein [Pseudorhodoplanes sp.]HWV41918.1 TerC family protein [Pseudorhodoplanes sp.]